MYKHITPSRIVGGILALLGIIRLLQKGWGEGLVLTMLGLVLILTHKEKAEKQFGLFVSSFKFDKNYLMIVLFDAVFWVLLIVLSSLFTKITKYFAQLHLSQVQFNPSVLNPAVLQQSMTGFKTFIWIAIVFAVLYLVIVFIAYALSRTAIWAVLTGKAFGWSTVKSFLKTSFVWMIVWAIAFTFLLLGLKPVYAGIVLAPIALVFIHYTSLLYYNATKEQKLKTSLERAFETKTPSFIYLYIYALVVFIISYQLIRLLPSDPRILTGALFLYAFLFLAWLRRYQVIVLERIK